MSHPRLAPAVRPGRPAARKKTTRRAKTPGFFVSFEGTEGAGKSTLLAALSTLLQERATPHLLTREPGGDPLAEKIRGLILGSPMHPRTELFLYEAARAEHLERTILPALNQGKVVLCDRFADSTLAYQAHARGLPWREVEACNRIATGGLKPQLTVLLVVDPALGLSRARDPNRFEREGVAFQGRVLRGFLKAKRLDPRRWLVLRARESSPEDLARRVLAEIKKRGGLPEPEQKEKKMALGRRKPPRSRRTQGGDHG
jgi:dTMP kinase